MSDAQLRGMPGLACNEPTQGPWQRVWARFKRHRRGYLSLWIFSVLFVLSLGAELLANNRPLLIYYEHQLYVPLIHNYPETAFGGDFATNADYTDPYVIAKIREHGWLLRAPIPFSYDTIDYYNPAPNPAAPTSRHWLGTDDRGRDVAARLIYGFRLSVLFGFALTAIGMVIGMLAGAIQGYLGGKVDLFFQRFIEIWGSLPELYLLIIFASIFEPSIGLLLILLSLFGWIGLSDYVRAEFLKGRNLEYVRAARALGVSSPRIMLRHLLPNAMTPVITFLPFRVSGAILALTSLDFLGLGVPPSTPSLGELLAQGKNNIDAWWLSLTTFGVLVGTLLLLIFIGEALRAALDTRKA
ncbi:MAG: ABC transporter permease [Halothiobacillus sp.]